MEPTPFENSAQLAERLASSFALQQALDSLDEARKQGDFDTEQVQITVELLCSAIIAFAGNDIIEA